MKETICENISEMLVLVREQVLRHGSVVFSSDNPKQLMIGFTTSNTNPDLDQGFYVRLIAVRSRRWGSIENLEVQEYLTNLLKNSTGRAEIANILSASTPEHDFIEDLDRKLKLKAFW